MLLLVASFSLIVSCASNTQSENTTIGAVTGAVVGGVAGSAIGSGAGQVVAIGAGAIIGALIGGEIGQSMESSDNTKAYYAMEHNPPHKATHWKNKKTGKHYTFVPTSERMSLNGNTDCRHYHAIIYTNGKKQQVTGTACRQSNGTWQSVSA
jgi:surface antigen